MLGGDDAVGGQEGQRAPTAALAEEHGVRVAIMRTGVVLSRDAGALQKMLPPFQLGAGGPIAGGRQYMPWIHRDDEMSAVGPQ